MPPRLAPVALLEQIPDPLLAAFRECMSAAGYVGEVFAQVESVLPGAPDRARLPLIRWLLERRTEPWAAFCLLFNYSGALTAANTCSLLGNAVCDALRGAGVLVPDPEHPDRLRSMLHIMPFLGLWIIGDPPDAGAEAVMVPARTTMQLALLMPEKVTGDVLDVGCGPGTLALVGARRGARSATGVDINERAIRIARVNARLNDVTAEFLAGDLYAPVQGRSFDLVVSQPPYVIQLDAAEAVVFLHAGPRGDRLTLRVLAGLPAALAPGGIGIVLADLALPPSGSLSGYLRNALGSQETDLVAATAPAPPIELQSFVYAQLEDSSLGPHYVATAGRYLERLSTLDPPGFRQAAIMVRSAAGPAIERRALTATFPVCGFGGATSRAADRFLAAADLATAPAAPLRRRAMRLTRRARWSVEGETPIVDGDVAWNVRFSPGALGVDQSLPQASVTLLLCIDAAANVDGGLAAYAQACDASVDEITTQALDFLRHALRTGLLEPADDATEPATKVHP